VVRNLAIPALLLSLLGVLQGCDLIVGGVLLSQSAKKKSGSASIPPPPPDPRYFVYAANLTAGTESTEQTNIKAAGGNPGVNWTLLGGGTATADYVFPSGMNAVLIQATTVQAYDIDAVEGHDAADHVVSTFTTTNFPDQVTNPANIAGFPDGLTATATAAPTQMAFIFQILPASATTVVTVRIFIAPHSGARASGDPNWTNIWIRGADQIPGGAAANSVGTVFFGATDAGTRNQWLLAISSTGSLQTGALYSLESGTNVAVGNNSVAVDSKDNVIVANTSTNNITTSGHSAIRWRKLNPGTAIPPVWPVTPTWDQTYSFAGINLVGSNGVAIDGSDNVYIAGGNDVGTVSSQNGRLLLKIDGSTGGNTGTLTGPADINSTWWRGIVIGPGTSLEASGDVTSGITGPVEIFTRTTDTGFTTTSDATYTESGTPADLGSAIAVDSGGNKFIGGFLGVSGPSKNAIILKLPAGSTTPAQWFLETTNAPSEILGLLALPDGTLYAVGYETVTSPSQGQNILVLKIGPAGNILWKRTYDSGFGDDQAVSAALTSTSLVVVGQVSTNPSGTDGKDIFIISYVR
jgi:hypothetical protein